MARFALLGTRGIPANYGGFETFAEELSQRLVNRGHRVTVYCRERHTAPQFKGVDLVYLPTIRHKYFDTIAHTAISTLHLLFHRYDAVLYCNAANAIFTILPRALGMPVALNVDGLERNRKKWNSLGRTWYLISEWLSTKLPTRIVTDAEEIERYYMERYGAESDFISYGAETRALNAEDALQPLGLARRQYFLYVSRMEPENNALLVREAFEKTATDLKLALIGEGRYAVVTSNGYTQNFIGLSICRPMQWCSGFLSSKGGSACWCVNVNAATRPCRRRGWRWRGMRFGRWGGARPPNSNEPCIVL